MVLKDYTQTYLKRSDEQRASKLKEQLEDVLARLNVLARAVAKTGWPAYKIETFSNDWVSFESDLLLAAGMILPSEELEPLRSSLGHTGNKAGVCTCYAYKLARTE